MISRPHTQFLVALVSFQPAGLTLCCEKSNAKLLGKRTFSLSLFCSQRQMSTSSACDRNTRIFKRSLDYKNYRCGILQQQRK